MSKVLAALSRHGRAAPGRAALASPHIRIRYGELPGVLVRTGELLARSGAGCLGLALENSPAWVAADLAALGLSLPVVPLPGFFSPAQTLHALRDGVVDTLLTDRPDAFAHLLDASGFGVSAAPPARIAGRQCRLLRLTSRRGAKRIERRAAKITYTSGTTGEPKGVRLDREALEQVAVSLAAAARFQPGDRHVALLPLSTLLENVAGIYAPLLAGATCCLPALAEAGMTGASGVDARRLLDTLALCRASTAIFLPQMLQALVALLETGAAVPPRLRFVAVGGAPVSERLLRRASDLGVPVYQGYGLSECASVVALNTPSANRPGSVGRPLPHAAVACSADGEVRVSGAGFLGYTGTAGKPRDPWPTGDLGHLDRDGYLWITGRRKHIFITSFGRNLAPEWVEAELTADAGIVQAAVFGEARPWNVAVIVSPLPAAAVDARVTEANARLPDYARVQRWIAADAPFSAANCQLTPNGRLRRPAILAAYRDAIDQLYRKETHELL